MICISKSSKERSSKYKGRAIYSLFLHDPPRLTRIPLSGDLRPVLVGGALSVYLLLVQIHPASNNRGGPPLSLLLPPRLASFHYSAIFLCTDSSGPGIATGRNDSLGFALGKE